MNRRDFFKYTGAAVVVSKAVGAISPMDREEVPQNTVLEKSFRSARHYENPFSEIDFSVTITFPDGSKRDFPGYWAGGCNFKFRFSSHVTGIFYYATVCSMQEDEGLNNLRGTFRVVDYQGENELLRHGALRVSENKRYFEHIDGTPFLWLGDTWWCGLAKRLRWPDEFKLMTKDRREKGFNAVQFTVGLAPSGTYFDPKNVNEAGLPWDESTNSINPEYFDSADLRVFHLVDSSIVPVVVPCWGFYILRMGIENTRRLWKYVMARWGALPAVWCLAGEVSMPYYTSESRGADSTRQIEDWSAVLAYLKSINCYGHMISAHPRHARSSKAEVIDPSLLDFDMLQAGHIYVNAVPKAMELLKDSLRSSPRMPALVDEVAYEGIGESNWEDIQRLLFWASVLSGSPGYTYGAHGITQFNSTQFPSYVQPQGMSWGEEIWENAYQHKGSHQVGVGKTFLNGFNWWEMEPHPEWVLPAKNESLRAFTAYAAGIPRKLRLIYFSHLSPTNLMVLSLEPDIEYDAYFVVPSSGKKLPIGKIQADEQGHWSMDRTRKHDLLLVMKSAQTKSDGVSGQTRSETPAGS